MPDSAKRASVIIPAYNAQDTIAEAILSAFNQVPKPFEIVVGDDGSTDRTAQVAEDLGCKVLRLPHVNGAVARNSAVAASSCEVLLFLDADDRFRPDKIRQHLDAHESGGAPLVLDRAKPFIEGKPSPAWTAGRAEPGTRNWRDLLSHRAWPTGSGFSVTREAYDAVGGFNPALSKYQDVDFWVRCAHRLGSWTQLDNVLTDYRVSPGSVSKRTDGHEASVTAMLAGWPFATEDDKQRIRRVANLMMAEQQAFPGSLAYLNRAGWPVTMRFFWKCLYVSIKRTMNQS
jgi:glycosyltransferase involved in cell wall biosynthesis